LEDVSQRGEKRSVVMEGSNGTLTKFSFEFCEPVIRITVWKGRIGSDEKKNKKDVTQSCEEKGGKNGSSKELLEIKVFEGEGIYPNSNKKKKEGIYDGK
jgi:hypothetical protein